MRILALETDPDRIKRRFCHAEEQEILTTYFHGMRFFFAIVREILITLALVSLAVLAWVKQWPFWSLGGVLITVWFIFVFFSLLRAYIDWAYDFLWVTTDKILLVDQTSVLRQEIKPIHIENIGGISTATQLWGLFSFGILKIHLKEGLGGDILLLKYVPNAGEVAARMTAVVTQFQRRDPRAPREPGALPEAPEVAQL